MANISAINYWETVGLLTQSCDCDFDFGLDIAKLVLSFTHVSGPIFNPKVLKKTNKPKKK